MFTAKKRGSLIVDAAICLPVFLIALSMLLVLIAQSGKELKSYHSLSRRALYITLAEAGAGEAAEGESAVLPSGRRVDHLQTLSAGVRTTFPVPKAFFRGFSCTQRLRFRPFAGQSKGNGRAERIMVYVFERHGERYHIEGCCILTRERKRGNKTYSYMKQEEAEERGYTPCRLCVGGEEWGFTK